MSFNAFITRNRVSAAVAALSLTLPATAAFAVGAIVYDPSNYLQSVKQVQAWELQYRQMTEGLAKAEATLQQVKSQVNAITGVRGFGDIVSNPLLRNIVPADLSTTLADLNSTGRLTGKALDIRAGSTVYDCGDLTDAARKSSCQAVLGQTAQAMAYQQDTLALLNQRSLQIDALRAQINTTQDPKAIAELQARIAAEQAQVSNDQNKILLANAMLTANAQAAAQTQQERVNQLMATNKPSALERFSFTALGYMSSKQTASVDQ